MRNGLIGGIVLDPEKMGRVAMNAIILSVVAAIVATAISMLLYAWYHSKRREARVAAERERQARLAAARLALWERTQFASLDALPRSRKRRSRG